MGKKPNRVKRGIHKAKLVKIGQKGSNIGQRGSNSVKLGEIEFKLEQTFDDSATE